MTETERATRRERDARLVRQYEAATWERVEALLEAASILASQGDVCAGWIEREGQRGVARNLMSEVVATRAAIAALQAALHGEAAIELLDLHYLVVPDSVAARIAAVMDERDAAIASEDRLRERVREAAERHERSGQAAHQFGHYADEERDRSVARVLRQLLNEEE